MGTLCNLPFGLFAYLRVCEIRAGSRKCLWLLCLPCRGARGGVDQPRSAYVLCGWPWALFPGVWCCKQQHSEHLRVWPPLQEGKNFSPSPNSSLSPPLSALTSGNGQAQPLEPPRNLQGRMEGRESPCVSPIVVALFGLKCERTAGSCVDNSRRRLT